jgi:hypothetical protein
MSNSYGFNGDIPESALYGWYDNANGEWLGLFFSDKKEALQAALDNDDKNISVMSVDSGEVLE